MILLINQLLEAGCKFNNINVSLVFTGARFLMVTEMKKNSKSDPKEKIVTPKPPQRMNPQTSPDGEKQKGKSN